MTWQNTSRKLLATQLSQRVRVLHRCQEELMMTLSDDSISMRDLLVAAGLGALAGVRASLPNALLGRASNRERSARRGKQGAIAGLLGSGVGARALTLAGLAELIGDKLPGVPARVDISPRLARIGSGGLAAALLGRPRPKTMATLAFVGGASAALSTVLSYRLRKRAMKRWGMSSASSGLLEDVLVLTAAAALLPQLRRELGGSNASGPSALGSTPELLLNAARTLTAPG
jgi:uncharacterized membrane protein